MLIREAAFAGLTFGFDFMTQECVYVLGEVEGLTERGFQARYFQAWSKLFAGLPGGRSAIKERPAPERRYYTEPWYNREPGEEEEW